MVVVVEVDVLGHHFHPPKWFCHHSHSALSCPGPVCWLLRDEELYAAVGCFVLLQLLARCEWRLRVWCKGSLRSKWLDGCLEPLSPPDLAPSQLMVVSELSCPLHPSEEFVEASLPLCPFLLCHGRPIFASFPPAWLPSSSPDSAKYGPFSYPDRAMTFVAAKFALDVLVLVVRLPTDHTQYSTLVGHWSLAVQVLAPRQCQLYWMW